MNKKNIKSKAGQLDRVIFRLCCRQIFHGPYDSFEQLFTACYPRGKPSLKPNFRPGMIFRELMHGWFYSDAYDQDRQLIKLAPKSRSGRSLSKYITDFELAFAQIWKFEDLPREFYFYMMSLWILDENLVKYPVINTRLIKEDPLNFLVCNCPASIHYSYLTDEEKEAEISNHIREFFSTEMANCYAECFFPNFTVESIETIYDLIPLRLLDIILPRAENLIQSTEQIAKLASYDLIEDQTITDLLYHAAIKFDDFDQVFSREYRRLVPYFGGYAPFHLGFYWGNCIKRVSFVINQHLHDNRALGIELMLPIFNRFSLTDQFYLCDGHLTKPQEIRKFGPPSGRVMELIECDYMFETVNPLHPDAPPPTNNSGGILVIGR